MSRRLHGFTAREMDVLMTICSGATRKEEIAAELAISLPTVRTHVNNIYSKARVGNLAGLVLFVINNPSLRIICFPWLKVSSRE